MTWFSVQNISIDVLRFLSVKSDSNVLFQQIANTLDNYLYRLGISLNMFT
jgi:hypothetical protein